MTSISKLTKNGGAKCYKEDKLMGTLLRGVTSRYNSRVRPIWGNSTDTETTENAPSEPVIQRSCWKVL